MALGEVTLSVVRRTQTVTNYRPSLSTDDSFDVVGSLQPVSGEELNALPTGLRPHDARMLYCELNQPILQSIDSSPSKIADEVSTNDVGYRVHKVFNWSTGPYPHYAYLLVAQQTAAGVQ